MNTDKRTFSEAFDLLLKIQSSQSKNTFAQARCVVAHLRPWFEENAPSLDEFETSYEETWAMYRSASAGQITRKGKPRRLTHDRRYLVQALKRANTKGWIKKSFTKKDFTLKEAHEPIGKHLDDESVVKLIRALEIHPRTQLQVKMAVYMGMRLSEILKLRVAEVDLINKQISLDPNRLKTRQPRKVPIPIANKVYPELAKWVESAKGSCVFPMDRNPDEAQSDNRHWWTLARKASGIQCRFHDLRHTAVTNAVAEGIPTEWISKVFGATPQVLSRVYAHLREDDKEQFRSFLDRRFQDETDSQRRNILSGDSVQPSGRFNRFRTRLRAAVTRLAA